MPYSDPDKQRENVRRSVRKYREKMKRRKKNLAILNQEVVESGEEEQT